MATYYVRTAGGSSGSNTAPYDTFAKAALLLSTVTALATSADTIWLAPDHAEAAGSAQTWTLPTTPGLRILCAGNLSEPPTALAATAVCATTAGASQTFSGYGYIEGVTFQCGASGAPLIILGIASTAALGLVLKNCTFYLGSAAAAQAVRMGSSYSGGMGTGASVQLINPIFRATHASQSIHFFGGKIEIDGLSFHASSTVPTSLFGWPVNSVPSNVEVSDSDLSGKAFTNLVTVATASPSEVLIRNCKLPASIAVVTATPAQFGSQRIRMHNCDSGDTHIRIAEHSGAGVVTSDTAVTRTGGAVQDDATAHSWRMTGNATTQLLYPLRSPETITYNSTVGSPVTATLEVLRDSVTNLTDAQAWLEVTYLGVSGAPQGISLSDRVATVIATAADQDASSAIWTHAMTNPNEQALSVTFTPQEPGYVVARAFLAANTAINVDPQLALS